MPISPILGSQFTRSTRCDRMAKRFTAKERASYRAGFKAGVKFGKARAKGDLRKHAKREGWY